MVDIMVDVQIDLCIQHMKTFISNLCSMYITAPNTKSVHKKFLNPYIEQMVGCYIEPLTSIFL